MKGNQWFNFIRLFLKAEAEGSLPWNKRARHCYLRTQATPCYIASYQGSLSTPGCKHWLLYPSHHRWENRCLQESGEMLSVRNRAGIWTQAVRRCSNVCVSSQCANDLKCKYAGCILPSAQGTFLFLAVSLHVDFWYYPNLQFIKAIPGGNSCNPLHAHSSLLIWHPQH